MNNNIEKTVLSWAFEDNPSGRNGGSQWQPKWDFIADKLRSVKHSCGTVTLRKNNGMPDAKSISVHAQSEAYFIIFNDVSDGKHITRKSWDPDIPGNMYEMHGHEWDVRMIFSDYGLVYDVFKQFYENDEVQSSRLL